MRSAMRDDIIVMLRATGGMTAHQVGEVRMRPRRRSSTR